MIKRKKKNRLSSEVMYYTVFQLKTSQSAGITIPAPPERGYVNSCMSASALIRQALKSNPNPELWSQLKTGPHWEGVKNHLTVLSDAAMAENAVNRVKS